ncbi:coiled-coil domain-containing protein 18 [Brachionichthys hirsutus]|uniref:coiled-coil domain-containing protein 18 n=1 Tax=Brachionichthys hirsutus TaxID=412623 RepID=UPI00360482BB
MDPVPSRKKAGCVRQENACLTTHDEQLISDLDAVQHNLTSFDSQASLRGRRVGVRNNLAVMSEQVSHLQAELASQAEELKCRQEAAAHSDIMVATLTVELNALRDELETKAALGKRAEQQRNQALQNAETLKEALKDYKSNISIKLKKLMESEGKVKDSLFECDRQKAEFEMKCAALEREKAEQSQMFCQLKEDLRQALAAASVLQTQLGEREQNTLQMERRLMECGAGCEELASLNRDLQELRALTETQKQRVAQSHRESQQSQAELASMEAILALLHLREGAAGPLCARPCMLPSADCSGTAHRPTITPGEGYQQLLRVLQSMEAGRTKQNILVERLQERLGRAQEEISSLQNSMAQRASHYQNLHTELLDKVSQATVTEKELKRKSARVASLEKQLQEKASAYTQAALRNTELEKQLLEKASAVQHYQALVTKKQREYQQSLEKCTNSQSQQFTEQQHRMEMLQKAQSRLLKLEHELRSLQKERDEAQRAAVFLQSSLDQLTQQKQVEGRHSEELLQSSKEQAAQSASKVCELQASLSKCREELNACLQQTEAVKNRYENELGRKNDTVSSLQEKLQSVRLICQSSTEQNVQLQLSLQRQQTMLTESSTRISELEESQSQLQSRVSVLEQHLEKARASLQDEVGNREREAQAKEEDLQEMNRQNAQLSASVSQLTSETSKYRGELESKDSELQRLKKEVAIKTSQISQADESLQSMKWELIRKTDQVIDLEEALHRCEADKLNCAQQVQFLDGQLQTVRQELADALEQLQEVRDALQRTQTIADERNASVDSLTLRLSETTRELEERTHEVLDMDNALKERQGELQQRAKLLSQLEVAIREHKQEMARKVESLQQSLEVKEKELRDAQRELNDKKLQESRELQVCQQKLQTLQKELEETQHHREVLSRQLDAAKLHITEKELRLCSMEEELTLKESHWLQSEAGLQTTVAALEQELEVEKERHNKELDSLQQTRGQLLKVSEQISSTMRSTHEQLAARLHQSQDELEQVKVQLDQTETELDRTRKQNVLLQTQRDQTQTQLLQNKAQLEQSRLLYEQTRAQNGHLHFQLEQLRLQVAHLQARLQACERSMEASDESLLIKESEVTRLQARISSLERAAGQQRLCNHTLSLPALHQSTHSPEESSSSHSAPPSPKKPQNRQAVVSSSHGSVTRAANCPSSQNSSVDSSLDLPLSLKATLKEALCEQSWEASSPSPSSFQDTVDHSWQGLSGVGATAASDYSFNPLTYMVDEQDGKKLQTEATPTQEGDDGQMKESRRESVSAPVGQEDVDMSSLTGMLKFVNQTLAMQEEPSLWSSTGLSEPGHSFNRGT